jgi:hypothetical protein
MGARVQNDGQGKYRTDLKRNRYLPYNIFLKREDVRRAYSGREANPVNLFDYIASTLDQEAGCTCTSYVPQEEPFAVFDLFIPENVFVNSKTSNSDVRRGYANAIDLVDAILTVKKSDEGCTDKVFPATKQLVLSPQRLRELYIPSMVTKDIQVKERDFWGKYNSTQAQTERPNNAINLKDII